MHYQATHSPYKIIRPADTCPHTRTIFVNYRQTACIECGALFHVIHADRS